MTGIDWLILGIVLLLALFGWAQGFVAGALALLGFAFGAWVGTRIGPLVLHGGRHSPWAPAFALIGALVAGAVFALGFEGLGARLRGRMASPAASAVDGMLGAVLTGCVGLCLAWVLGALALANGGEARREVQRSAILQALNGVLPPSNGLIDALARLDPFPRIDGPEARVPAPTASIARADGVRAARQSVVKILGSACGLGIEGSGWVAGNGLVVTNAHVVAGQKDTRVLAAGHRPGLEAHAVAFDPHNDIAVLQVSGLEAARADAGRRPAGGHVGGDPRVPGQRAVRRAGGPAGADARGDHPGRVRTRPGAALDRVAARRRALGEFRWADGGRAGRRRDHDLRRHDQRSSRRLRGPERDSAWRFAEGKGVGGGLDRALRRVAPGPGTAAGRRENPS